MKRPTTKFSERWSKEKPIPGYRSEDSPADIAQKELFRWINTRLGWQLAALLLVLFGLWVGWDKVNKLPGVASVLNRVAELRPVPRASGDKFSILIARLDNDKDDVHRRLIDDALRGRMDEEVEVLLPERTISISGTDKPQVAVKAGHERARATLRESNANVMIWGEVLAEGKAGAPIRLHWSVNTQSQPDKEAERYLPADKSYDLPELFWTDLGNVLGLLATSQSLAIADKSGTYVADQLEPLVKRVRLLVASGKLKGENHAELRMVLANGLSQYGKQRGDLDALTEAVVIYRDLLTEYTRERAPLDWAMTQNNLGAALSTLGQFQNKPAQLVEAVAAYREALKEYTRNRAPVDWAMTQNNLGNALSRLGERESGTARLDQAVAAYREALKERTRERVPLAWASTQRNMGIALCWLGERERGTGRLDEAVTAYREALKEHTRVRVPLEWASTQNAMGIALWRIGEQESGTAQLDRAVVAFLEALKERTRERMPLDWAMTQNNLGGALHALGLRMSGTEEFERAAQAFRLALEVFRERRAGRQEAAAQQSLTITEALLAARKKGFKVHWAPNG